MSESPSIPRRASEGRGRGLVVAIAQKELRELARDGRFWLIGLIVAGLLLTALSFGVRKSREVAAERRDAQAVADAQWREQDEKNPHAAAHYGSYVFKPVSVLTLFDPGVDPFVGVAIKLEAHRRNPLEGAPAQDGTALQRFGRMSMAGVLQLLVPLLIIGLGFGAFSSERERGTLRQLVSLGVAPSVLLAGKALGLAAALCALLVPALVLGVAAVAVLFEPEAATSVGPRLGLLALVHVGYFAAYLGLTLLASALAPSSRAALIGLLAFWVGSTLVVPRAAADLGARLSAAPGHGEIAEAVRHSFANGLPGGPPREQRVDALSTTLLERYGFKDAELVMDEALLAGIELQAEAAFENEVIDHHFAALERTLERQERGVQWASVLSPFHAVQRLSMALAGTDYPHHRDFADAAEQHRRALVDSLNRAFADATGPDVWSYRAGRELWEKAPPFTYAQPSALAALREASLSLALLLAWLALSCLGAGFAVARMRVS